MIVADATLIIHFSMPGSKTEQAEAVRRKDPTWAAPPLWEYEVLNVIWTYVHFKDLPLMQALEHWEVAQDLIGERTYRMAPAEVLRLAAKSGHSAYDCQYVAVAQQLDAWFVTSDAGALATFPEIAISPDDFLAR
jgi:predicted nucleic acid-binding protein